jgi:hypothetical protein
VDTDEAGFESFMELTLSALEALVMRRVWISKEAPLVVASSGQSPARPHVLTLCGLPHSSTIMLVPNRVGIHHGYCHCERKRQNHHPCPGTE